MSTFSKVCTVCGTVIEFDNWNMFFLAGWVYEKIAGVEHIRCPQCAKKPIERGEA